MHTNRERAAALLRAERRVQEREKWLEGEQQELDQTRDRVKYGRVHISRRPKKTKTNKCIGGGTRTELEFPKPENEFLRVGGCV